ncbi:probable 39S ribosomal protein L45, mitochondrial [Orussus abietinus]|uniref:probable 39S ribosomal protein L45, mitochondrial n=1 Tax=Orussus abietinus TaxID=222816 RepID=UPI000625CC57|nr:probable 39S ribosomal protein L45, mitochondrial [Orussus abietinus]
MSRYTVTGISALGRIIQQNPGLLVPGVTSSWLQHSRAKHWNPQFKKFRREKVIKVELPDYNLDVESLSKEEMRSHMKKMGLQPMAPSTERTLYFASTQSIFEPYIPPEGDGKFSAISTTGAKQKLEFVEKKGKSMLALRKIRSFEEDFDVNIFVEEARDIYIKAHEALASKDRHQLRQYVTERAYPDMRSNTLYKTIHWKFLESLEPARAVHVRCTDMITKENIFAQITVRFHTQQLLAIYDRFGRLMHGSEILKKDVLEYVVFEKHVADEYGTWRIHGKIIPPWMSLPEPAQKTYIKKPEVIEKTVPVD